MFGQGSPRLWPDLKNRSTRFCEKPCLARLGICVFALVLGMLPSEVGVAEEITVRLRIVWGNSSQAKDRWLGQVSVEGGAFSELQPLGLEVDASVATHVDGNRLVVGSAEKRAYDGCDVTVRGEEDATVRFELRAAQSPQTTLVEASLGELATQQLNRQLDDLGSYLTVDRSPGDKLRVVLARDHLVFQPNEVWNLGLETDLAKELGEGPVQLEIRLHRTGGKKVLWQAGRQLEPKGMVNESSEFEIICPDQEGAYRLTISARHLENLATRFLPGQQAKLLASRDVEFVVVDPLAKQPLLTDHLELLLSIDPANPRWWQRLPSWAQVTRLRGGAGGRIGNIQPVLRQSAQGNLVELPSAPKEGDPYWQSYSLAVRDIGKPHVVELQYPLSLEQHLAISVIEPDAAGRVATCYRDSGLITKAGKAGDEGQLGTHRFVFWPRTESPQLLIVNRHPTKPGQYGKIEIFRQEVEAELEEVEPTLAFNARLVACYLSEPRFAESLGTAESFDAGSGLSVQTWATFLDGANRLSQYLRYHGYNGVVLGVAGDGSALYPSKLLSPSPRYDTGLQSSSGQDPVKKDVLEMLLRVFNREGLRVVPQLELSAALPRLEELRRNSVDQSEGIVWIGPQGNDWLAEHLAVGGRAPHYNVLNDRVQGELRGLAGELGNRYRDHASFAGVSLKISGEGYGLLPGLAWGMDDTTVADFSRETGVGLPSQGPERFRLRAEHLLGAERERWQDWRSRKLTQMYAQIAGELVATRSDLQLVLATEDIFAGATMERRVRKAISRPIKLSQVLLEHGLDFSELGRTPGIVVLSTSRRVASNDFQERALDLRINAGAAEGEVFPLGQKPGILLHRATGEFRLTSFDLKSPLGSKQTRLSVAGQSLTVGAEERRRLTCAFARSDAEILVDGGRFLAFGTDSESRSLLETLQQLPAAATEVRSESAQPVVMRVYRDAGSTTLLLINESPWSTRVRLPLSVSLPCDWRKLGKAELLTGEEVSGTVASGDQRWLVGLKPYDLQAWKFDSSELRLGKLRVTPDPLASHDLQERIDQIELRTGNLNIRRLYPQLPNPGFELEEAGGRIVGWQPQAGLQGQVEVVRRGAYSGTRALRIRSHGAGGAAIQSSLFPTPRTGQLMVSGWVDASAEAKLQIIFEDAEGGRIYRQYAILRGSGEKDRVWSKFEFPVDDIPFGTGGQMRVRFHLTGEAEVLLDDIELHDLRFDKLQRGALVKGVYAAKTALDEGQVVDCLRLVDQYWSQYLIEFVPPVEARVIREAKQPSKPKIKDEKKTSSGISGRIRSWVPKIWR